MPEVICSKLALDSVSGRREFPYRHRPGATHNNIDRSDIGVDLAATLQIEVLSHRSTATIVT